MQTGRKPLTQLLETHRDRAGPLALQLHSRLAALPTWSPDSGAGFSYIYRSTEGLFSHKKLKLCKGSLIDSKNMQLLVVQSLRAVLSSELPQKISPHHSEPSKMTKKQSCEVTVCKTAAQSFPLSQCRLIYLMASDQSLSFSLELS